MRDVRILAAIIGILLALLLLLSTGPRTVIDSADNGERSPVNDTANTTNTSGTTTTSDRDGRYEKGPDYPIRELYSAYTADEWSNGTLDHVKPADSGLILADRRLTGRFETPAFHLYKLHEFHINVSIPNAGQSNVSLVIVDAPSTRFADVNETTIQLEDGMNKIFTQFFGGPYFRIGLELTRTTVNASTPRVNTIRVWGDPLGDGLGGG